VLGEGTLAFLGAKRCSPGNKDGASWRGCRASSIVGSKKIRGRAVARGANARQARNRDLDADAVEIRMRAARRIDEMRQAQTVGPVTASRSQPAGGLVLTPPGKGVRTVASQGVDKNLAKRASGRPSVACSGRHLMSACGAAAVKK
jgi:hypothetical protein